MYRGIHLQCSTSGRAERCTVQRYPLYLDAKSWPVHAIPGHDGVFNASGTSKSSAKITSTQISPPLNPSPSTSPIAQSHTYARLTATCDSASWGQSQQHSHVPRRERGIARAVDYLFGRCAPPCLLRRPPNLAALPSLADDTGVLHDTHLLRAMAAGMHGATSAHRPRI